jgi:putative membrane protein
VQYVLRNWSFDPFLIIVAALVGWHEIGLRRLARRSRPERTRQRRIRSLWFYSGLAVLLIAVESPIDYWADKYFFVHMIQHLLLMFAAPSLVVAGAPWQPLLDALPGRSGRAATRGVLTGGWSRPLRAVAGFFLRPWPAVVTFNVVMVFWHLPGPFDLAENNAYVHIWLMHSSFFLAGVVFWLQFIPSPPFRSQLAPLGRAGALLGTNIVMIFTAMALSIFVTKSVYAPYNHVAGVTLPPFADQQIGAAILWVCGDFWALPTMIITVRNLIANEGGMENALDLLLRHGSRDASGWVTGKPSGLRTVGTVGTGAAGDSPPPPPLELLGGRVALRPRRLDRLGEKLGVRRTALAVRAVVP